MTKMDEKDKIFEINMDSVQNAPSTSSSSSSDVDSDEQMSFEDADSDDNSEDSENNDSQEMDDTNDDLINALNNAATKSQRNHPPEIKVEEFIVNVCFNPVSDSIALSNVTGDVLLYGYNNENVNLLSSIEVHEKACRDLKFNDTGDTLWTVSKDKSIAITDINTQKFKGFYDNAHEAPIYTVTLLTENTFATGDDDGTVKLWDTRQQSNRPIFSLKCAEEYVSCMLTNNDKKYLVCSSGDGSLITIDLPSKKLFCQSMKEYDEEFTCLGLFKNNTKILVTTSTGKLYIFNWGEFGLHSDEIKSSNKKAINCMVPIADNIAITGNDDGTLTALNLFPNTKIGIAGQHNISIESLDISNDGKLIASSSHDNIVKFWNVEYFETFNLNDKEVNKNLKDKHAANKYNLPSSKFENPSSFFADM